MKYYNYTLKIGILNILSIILFILCFIIVVPIYGVITLTNIPLMMILSILYLMLHEVVHYIGFIINKEVNSKNIVMGAELEKGIFYCMCKQKISKKTILISIFAPLTTLGFITLIIAMIFKLDLLIFLSILNISGSIGDIIMGLFIMFLPKDIMYLDLDDSTSFTLLCKEDINDRKFIGIQLLNSGEYKESMKAKDYTKFKVSKLSYIIIILFFIFSLLLFML